jgi:hypothetical protein
MIARVFVRRSQWAVAWRDPPRAIAFAHAAHATPGTSGHLRALCAMKAADGHALANDADACERSLADAHAYLDRADSAQPLDLPVTRSHLTTSWPRKHAAGCGSDRARRSPCTRTP